MLLWKSGGGRLQQGTDSDWEQTFDHYIFLKEQSVDKAGEGGGGARRLKPSEEQRQVEGGSVESCSRSGSREAVYRAGVFSWGESQQLIPEAKKETSTERF